MKKKGYLLTLILLVFIIPNSVSANTLGDLNYWYSDGNSIGRWHDSRYIYSSTLDDSFDTNQLIDLIGHAQTQWSNAGISSSRTPVKSGANIKVYAGRLGNIQKLYPNFKSTDAGLAHYKNTVTEGSWRIKGECTSCDTYKTGYEHKGIDIYIKNRPDSETETVKNNKLRNITTHEFGHAFGWRGHSSSSSDVMYGTVSQVTSVTSRDKNHISQVY